MQPIQTTFKRIEKKYVLTGEQMRALVERLEEHMYCDEYGLHGVSNIYFDTPDYALIRASVEKPVYKEKFRLRSYSTPGEEEIIFAELKKKYRGVVYKRRIVTDPQGIGELLAGRMLPGENEQIQREILWFLRASAPQPRVYIGYERFAMIGREDERLRVTFDTDIRWRQERLRLDGGRDGMLVQPENPIIMEIKIPDAAPLWLARLLSEMRIYPTSFSKYGACYQRHIAPRFTNTIEGDMLHA